MHAHQVNMYEAKTYFSKLVAEVEAGGEVIIARDGKPVARLVAIARRPVVFGSAKGDGSSMGADFDDPLPEDMLKDISP